MCSLRDQMRMSLTEPACIGQCIYAPGKLVLAGEYAVLEGAPAIVLAINSGVKCHIQEGHGIVTPMNDSSFVSPALEALSQTRRFVFEDWNPPALKAEQKPGFGGSAAACVASVYAAGRPLDDAFKKHHSVQGSGSGIDIAASIYGGTLWFRPGEVQALPPVYPLVIWSGQSAKTGPRIKRFLNWPNRHGFVHASAELVDSFSSDPVGVTRALFRLLVDAAQQADIPYLTPNLIRISQLAESCGGSAKPSGAGGGDCAVAFFSSRAASEQFQYACELEGLQIISVQPSKGVYLTTETD